MRSKLSVAAVAFAAFVALCGTRSAHAGEPAAPATAEKASRPWAENVPDEAQKQALLLFEEANKLFEDGQHAAALTKYRDALKVWDHPAIRYNAAVALIHLDQPLAAHENLEPALRYGEAPFSPETYQQALTYRKLLRGQLAELKVACAEPGAEVTIDGAALFVGPGEASRWLLPGAHQLVARKPGYLTETRSLTLLPGKPTVEGLALQELRSLPTKTARRWAAWMPWAVMGAGVVLAAVGIPVLLDARSNVDAYDRAVVTCASGQAAGCARGMLPESAVAALDTGRTENVVAISLFSVGAAVAVTGVALLVLNQPRVVPAREPGAGTTVAPVVGPGLVGLSLTLRR